MDPHPNNTNIDIVLGFFKPINVYFDDSTVASQTKSDDSDDSVASQTDSDDSDDSVASQTEFDDASQTETSIHSFVNEYGLEGASTILNSISEYPSDKILEVKHSFQQELDNTTDEMYLELLRDQIAKLEEQEKEREKFYKDHLISIVLESSESSEMSVQRKNLHKMLTLSQLVDTVLEMKFYFDLLEEKKSFEEVLQSKTCKRDKRYRKMCEKTYREIDWQCAEILLRTEPGRGCVICYEPRKYIIVDCGHYCLCDNKRCLERVRKMNKCPICRATVINVMRVFG